MPVEAEYAFALIQPDLKSDIFEIDNAERNIPYFPEYLSKRLLNWLEKYKSSLQPIVDNVVPFGGDKSDVTLNRTTTLIKNLCLTIKLYFEGKVFEATSLFNETMDEMFREVQKTISIPPNSSLYRARSGNSNEHFVKKHLFHIPYESRHKVSTNRYSIPGFPALYLGDSTYVCWEESNRQRLRDVSFSRFENTKYLNVIEITRFEDFHREVINEPQSLVQLTYLLRYISTFPLILACTCKVNEPSGSFKPEYIIPQLLMQYVTKQSDIDGIKFPSTKVDYNRINKINAYNYVFPVKSNKANGYCDVLKDAFQLTEPTSLEIEEILHNPRHQVFLGQLNEQDIRSFELQKGVTSYYINTSFGKIESILQGRNVGAIED